MFRSNHLVKQFRNRQGIASLLNSQKRFLRFNYDALIPNGEKPLHISTLQKRVNEFTSEDVLKHELRGRLGNSDMKSVEREIEQSDLQLKPYRFNEKHATFIKENFGFNDEDLEMAQSFDAYKEIMFKEDGRPNFDKWHEHIGCGSQVMDDTLNTLEQYLGEVEGYKRIKEEDDESLKDDRDFSALCSKRFQDEVEESMGEIVKRFKPELDPKTAVEQIDVQFDRLQETVYDNADQMKKLYIEYPTKTITRYAPMFQTDEHGFPTIQWVSPAFNDYYFPELRDMVLEELSVENFRANYVTEQKKYSLSYDEIVEKAHKHTLMQRRRELDPKRTTSVGTDKRSQEIAKQLDTIAEILEEANQLTKTKKDEDAAAEDEGEDVSEETNQEKEADAFVWEAIAAEAGIDKEQLLTSSSQEKVEPIDINAMLDAEEEEKKNKGA